MRKERTSRGKRSKKWKGKWWKTRWAKWRRRGRPGVDGGAERGGRRERKGEGDERGDRASGAIYTNIEGVQAKQS